MLHVTPYKPKKERRWPLLIDTDLAFDEYDTASALYHAEVDDHWQPLFLPTWFSQEKGPLHFKDYKLNATSLRTWGRGVTLLRKQIEERAHKVDATGARTYTAGTALCRVGALQHAAVDLAPLLDLS